MPHTDKATVLATAIKNLINTNKVVLGVDEVYYGDHNNIPVGTAVTVTAGATRRELAGVAGPGGRAMNYMNVVILILLSIVQDEATARLRVDQLAENITTLLHADTTVGGILIHGFVEEITPGVIFNKEGSMFRVAQLDYTGKSKTNITV